MRREINNIISVAYSALRIIAYKIARDSTFKSGIIQRFSPNVVLECNKGSKVTLGRKVRIHSGSKIKVRRGAQLTIGNNVKINYYCMIVCHNKVTIGDGTEFGPGVYVYDHDHDYRAGLKEEKYKSAPIEIGKNCWIGANTLILRGTILGDNCVVGSGCVVRGNYPNNSVIVQKRQESVCAY